VTDPATSSTPGRRGGLWRDSDFVKFWSGETLSLLGSQVSLIAIPLLAVTRLSASPLQMGMLNSAQYIPFLVLALVAGVWVDRYRRLPMMVATNFGRALLIGFVPLAITLKLLNMGLIITLVFLAGLLTVVFALAYQAYLPSLVGDQHLMEGNGKLAGSQSFAQMSGPGVAGLLVGTIGAPIAILINAVTYLMAGTSVLAIRRPEPAPVPEAGPRKSIWVQITHGVRLSVSNVYLRALGIEASIYNLFNQMLWAVLILHLSRDMHFRPVIVGLVLTSEGVGGVLGSLIAGRFTRRLGLGPALIVSIVVANLAPLLIPAAPSGWVLAAPLIGLALFINGAGLTVYAIQAISLRQAAVTPDVLGRTNAGYQFAVTGTAGIGSLIGGVLGESIGVRPTMVVGVLGTLVAMWFVISSPISRLRDLGELVGARAVSAEIGVGEA
jgi:MFS family permease